MAVVVMFFGLAHWNDAAVRHFAHHVLELDGGVIDAEMKMQTLFYVAQDAFAHGRWNVGDGDVTGECASFRADAPDVEIVHVVDSLDGANGIFNQFEFHAARGAFEQDVQGLAHDAKARPQDQHADSEGERRVDPVIAGDQDGPASGDYGGG